MDTQKYELVRGDRFQLLCHVTGRDFTDYTARIYWSTTAWGRTPNIVYRQENIEPENIDTNALTANFTLLIPSTDTVNLTAGSYLYGDLEFSNNLGDVATPLRIRLKILGDVTNG